MLINKVKLGWYGLQFWLRDVRPAVLARRAQRRDDIISQTLDKGYSNRAIMIECLTYATAGMVTTREFIVMVAWYMFERPELPFQLSAALRPAVSQLKSSPKKPGLVPSPTPCLYGTASSGC